FKCSFHETLIKDVFQLKDMEKIAPKEKGISKYQVLDLFFYVFPLVVPITQHSDSFWAFPTDRHDKSNYHLSEGNQKHANLQKSIEKAKIGRHETEERTMLAKELSSLRDQKEQLKAEVEKYKECDPQVVEEMRQANKVAKEAANRWTGKYYNGTVEPVKLFHTYHDKCTVLFKKTHFWK
uniref:Mnd1 HTH domain-containing protein n=1 Tax=Sus scrofa TaxID=9823 RepID=A0A8D1G420_PIG